MNRVWTHSPFSPEARAVLEPLAEIITGTRPPSAEWFELAATADALIVSGITLIDGATLDRLGQRVAVVSRPGIGVDMIDAQACTERGVLVVNTPDGPTESTAEHAIALMLNLAKGVAVADRVLRQCEGFPAYGVLQPGLELRGATLGLVGLGRIGGRVAEIARVIGMRVITYDPFVTRERAAQLGVELASSLERLLHQADVVSLHCPATPETHHLINATTLAQMKPGSYLVNVARGAIVDEAALVDAVRAGHLAGVGMDVFDPEPTIANHELYQLPNTICTPHIASYTKAGVLRMQVQSCEQVAYALRGERPPHLVNPEVWGHSRIEQRARS